MTRSSSPGRAAAPSELGVIIVTSSADRPHTTRRTSVVAGTRRRFAAVAVLGTLALVLAGCGSSGSGSGSGASTSPTPSASASSSSTSTASPSPESSLKAMVPAQIASDGVLTVGSDASYAPNEYVDTDGKTVIGMDVELFDAVAAKLGLKTQYTNAPFDSLLPSITSGKFEVGVSSFTINPDRLKQTNMVSYFNSPTQWVTKKGNPAGVDLNAPCGKKVAVQKATIQVDDLTKRSNDCKTAGKPEVTIDQYQGQDQATSSVVSGKDEAMLADLPIATYAVAQTKGQLEMLGAAYGQAPYGFVVAKKNTELADTLAAGVKAVIADGQYGKILDKYGNAQGALTAAQVKVNPKVS